MAFLVSLEFFYIKTKEITCLNAVDRHQTQCLTDRKFKIAVTLLMGLYSVMIHFNYDCMLGFFNTGSLPCLVYVMGCA